MTQLFPPERGAAQTRMMEFTRGLRARSFELTVLTALPNYPLGRIFPEYRGKTMDWDGDEKILRSHIIPFKRKSAALRLVTYLSFLNSSRIADKRQFAEGTFDIVIASSPPLFVGSAGVDIAKRHNAKLVFDVRDVWPDIAANMGLIKKGSSIFRWLETTNRRILQASSMVLVTNDSDSDAIARRNYPRDKILKIPNGANLDIFNPMSANEILEVKKKLGLENKFVICYSGSLNQGMNDVNTFVPLMAKLRDDPDIVLLIIGDGENLPCIREDTSSQNLKNIIFSNLQTPDELAVTLNAIDLGLIPRKALTNGSSGGLPVKMFECWSLKKPVLMAAGENTEERKLLEEVGGGIAVNPGDIDKMAEQIRRIKRDPYLGSELGENGRKAVLERFNRDATMEILADALMNL